MGKAFRSKDFIAVIVLLFIVAAFYWQTIVRGLLPVPTDTLIGLYHPWRDLYAETNPRGVTYKNFLITDPIRQQIPWRKLVVDSWDKGGKPGWDATSFAGSPLAFNIQSGAFYPLNILFTLFPFQTAWTLLIISQTTGMLLFTYLFLRRQQVDPTASVFGSVVMAFMGFSISWLTWGTIVSSFLWVPLMLVAVGILETEKHMMKRIVWELILLFSVLASVTAGHAQLALYSLGITALYALWKSIGARTLRPFRSVLFVYIVFGVLSFPWLIRYWSMIQNSLRVAGGSDYLVEGFFIPLQHLIQFLIPDFFGNPATLNYWGTWNYGELVGYVGAAGLICATLGVFSKHKDKWFWFGLLGLSLLFSVDSLVARLPYIMHLPIISSLQPTRLLSITGLSLAVLSAFGVEYVYSKDMNRHSVRYVVIAFTAIWLGIMAFGRFGMRSEMIEHVVVAQRNSYLPFAFAVATLGILVISTIHLFKKFRWVAISCKALLVALLVIDLLRFGWKFTPFTKSEYFFPETTIISYLKKNPQPQRVLTLSSDIMPANALGYYGIEMVGGYNPIYSARYARFVSAMESGIASDTLKFQRIIEPMNINSPLFRFFAAGYVVSRAPLELGKYEEVAREGETKLYKIPNPVERFYVADAVKIFANDSEVLGAMLLDTGVGFPVYSSENINEKGIKGTVRIDRYVSDGQQLTVEADGNSILVNATAFDPGWHAYVDDREVKIRKANYLFMGITVPAGKHTVRFEYR